MLKFRPILKLVGNQHVCVHSSTTSTSTSTHTFYTILPITSKNILRNYVRKSQPYLKLMRLEKPIGTTLLLYPCTWSIALATPAGELPSLYFLSLFTAGSVLMRPAACIINDMWDKDIDKMVERTKFRPLACRELNEKQATMLLAGLLSGSLGILLHIVLGASSLLLVIAYPLAKRITYWPQLMLGLTLNYGALLGYTAVTNRLDGNLILPLYISAICWTVIYDTIYAHQDKDDDLKIGVKSTALKFGDKTKQWLATFSAINVASLGYLGYESEQTFPYYIAVSAIGSHLLWQTLSVNINDSDDCWSKYRSNGFVGCALFAGIVLSTILKNKTTPTIEPCDYEQCGFEDLDDL